MKAIWTWISHNQAVFVALIISCGLMCWMFGCQTKVTSLIDPSKRVTEEELNVELETETQRLFLVLDTLVMNAEVKKKWFARQREIKQKLMDFALLASQGGTLNPSGLVGLVAGIVGIGAVIDNRIKDKVIKNRPLPNSVGRGSSVNN